MANKKFVWTKEWIDAAYKYRDAGMTTEIISLNLGICHKTLQNALREGILQFKPIPGGHNLGKTYKPRDPNWNKRKHTGDSDVHQST